MDRLQRGCLSKPSGQHLILLYFDRSGRKRINLIYTFSGLAAASD